MDGLDADPVADPRPRHLRRICCSASPTARSPTWSPPCRRRSVPDMNPVFDWHALAPDICLTVTMLVVLVACFVVPDRDAGQISRIAAIGVLVSLIPIVTLAADGNDRSMFGGAYVVDNYALALKAFFLVVDLRRDPAVGRLHRERRLLPAASSTSCLLASTLGLTRDGVGPRPHHDLRRARADLRPDVHPRRVAQARPHLERSGREVLPDRRAVVGADAVRHVADLRLHRLDAALRDLGVRLDRGDEAAADDRDLPDARRVRVQGQRGAVPLLGARHLRGCADSGHRVPLGRVEGRRFRRAAQHHLLRLLRHPTAPARTCGGRWCGSSRPRR